MRIGVQVNKNDYEWSYRIERNNEFDILTDDDNDYIICEESLKKNDDLIFRRENNGVVFSGYEKSA